jgi:uncharacterized coiled-coil protein SlyX
MSFKKDTEKRLTLLEKSLALMEGQVKAFGQILVAKEKEVERLAKQNNDLMNRFMATKWEQYALNNPEHFKDTEQPIFEDYSPLTDESMAGEVLTDEDLGK